MGMVMRGSGEKVDTFLLRKPYFRLPSEKAQGLPVIENELLLRPFVRKNKEIYLRFRKNIVS